MSCWLISAWLIGFPSDPDADVSLRDDPAYGDAFSVIGMQVSGIDAGPCGTRGDSMFGTAPVPALLAGRPIDPSSRD